MKGHPDFTVAMVIPTGVGASQGGYGGDATVWMNLLASVCDTLVTHPNVANAAAFQALPSNALYVEGYGLDAFFKGDWGLCPVLAQRLGVIVDAGLEAGMKTLHYNVINAVQATYGVPIMAIAETTEPLDLTLSLTEAGISVGEWLNPQAVLSVAKGLIETHGITALALVTRLEEPPESVYKSGVGVDPIGGLEAILSHTLVEALGIPVANAPCFDWEEAQPRRDELVHPFTASEYTTASFLPCVLRGLHHAPNFVPLHRHDAYIHAYAKLLTVHDLNAVVLPYDCMGGVPFLSALERGIPVIAVKSNQTVLALTAEALLGREAVERLVARGLYFEATSYDEAVGILQRLKLGLSAPDALGVARV
jgi:hypothetical protein